jgi:hypothetical protein
MRALVYACLVAALACANPLARKPASYTPPDTPDGKVTLALALAADITASPDDAGKILADHGMTSDQLEDLMTDIAADADMSEAYAKGRGK